MPITELLSTPLVLPAFVAGALAALIVLLMVLLVRRNGAGGLRRLLAPAAVIAVVALAAIAVLDRLAIDERAAERRALLARNAELTARAMAPGSALACLDAGAGETVETACEKAVFADAQSAARAVAYLAARLSLLWDAHELAEAGGSDLADVLAGTRRAIELDRFGIAAHVLSSRDGCTADNCDVFALLNDDTTLKANLKLRVFDQYVSRHAAAWTAPPPVAEKQPPAVSEAPGTSSLAAPAEPAPANPPVGKQWDFPSAASIPPVSIMNVEPKLPPAAADAKAAQPPGEGDGAVPVPPRRPQALAPAPAQTR